MLDPNEAIRGKGILELRRANVDVGLFPPDLMAQLEELNRHFIQEQETGVRLLGEAASESNPTVAGAAASTLSGEDTNNRLLRLGRGYVSDYFVTEQDQETSILDSPRVLVYSKPLESVRDLLPVLEQVAKEAVPLFVVAQRNWGGSNGRRGTIKGDGERILSRLFWAAPVERHL
jgi:hypothetical protein